MINLSAVKKAEPKKSSSGKTHPILPDTDGMIAKHVTNAVQSSEQIETLKGSLDQSSGELKSVAQSHFFRSCNGTDNLPSAYVAEGMNGERVQLQLKNQYYPISLSTKGSDLRVAAIKDIVGDKYDELFRQKFSIEIDGDAVPASNAQRFINALVGVCNLFCHQPDGDKKVAHDGAMDDVESILMLHEYPDAGVLKAKEAVATKASFHTERHHLLSADQNLKINQHMAVATTLKIKGVK